MTKIIISLLFGLSVFSNAVEAKGDAEAGKAKAAACGACHGVTGLSASPSFPNLAGQNDAYIAKQLADFKSGHRSDPLMSPMAAGLSSDDMDNLAAYFSSQSRTGETVASATGDTTAPAKAATNTVVVTKTPTAKLYTGSIKSGQEKSALCTSCHTADGNSVIPGYPKLAGQSAVYLAKQLSDFKTGVRKNAIMAGMAAGLSDDDMHDLASFYAVQTSSKGTDETSEYGKKLYLGGDASKGITACVACHGITGKGVAQAGFPVVSHQNIDYLKQQLTTFRDGTRENDRNGIMRNIAIKLSDNDINELATYMSSMK